MKRTRRKPAPQENSASYRRGAGQLYGVKPLDPVVLLGVVVTLAAVGLAACVMPARRATRLDPAMVLRDE